MAEEVSKQIVVIMENVDKKKAITKQLYVLLHSLKCTEDNCGVDNCALIKSIKQHMMSCTSGLRPVFRRMPRTSCGVDHCLSSRQILRHWKFCQKCDVCVSAMTDVYSIPLHKQTTQLKSGQTAKSMSIRDMDSLLGCTPEKTGAQTPYMRPLPRFISDPPLAYISSGIQRLPNTSFGNDFNKIVDGFDSICLDSSIELDSE